VIRRIRSSSRVSQIAYRLAAPMRRNIHRRHQQVQAGPANEAARCANVLPINGESEQIRSPATGGREGAPIKGRNSPLLSFSSH
jgi:hypothetical protein